jgi:hypothetical protein
MELYLKNAIMSCYQQKIKYKLPAEKSHGPLPQVLVPLLFLDQHFLGAFLKQMLPIPVSFLGQSRVVIFLLSTCQAVLFLVFTSGLCLFLRLFKIPCTK